MAEIYCKRCLHHEELGRPLRVDEACPACGSGVHRRKSRPRPATHFTKVLRAIFTLRGIGFLVFFSLIGMVPIGVLAWASIIMLFLGGLKLAMKSMNVAGDKIEFPEVSPEELLDKRALIPALTFVFLFVWAPPILAAYGISGAFTLSPGGDETSLLTAPAKPTTTSKELPPEFQDIPSAIPGLGMDGKLDPSVQSALQQAGLPPDALNGALQGKLDQKALEKALQSTPAPAPHLKKKIDLDTTQVLALVFGALLFLWAPMAVVLYLRTSSTLAMLHVPAGLATIKNDVGGYLALCAFVLPALAVRFLVDAYTSTSFFASPPSLFVKGVMVLVSWALCGLYVRQHARAFDLPVDDDDWVPHGRAPAPVVKGSLIR